jgi:hypothetical protein
MIDYDLCLAWSWEFDADFVAVLNEACRSRGMSLLQITPDNLEGTLESLRSGQAAFHAFYDRASDADPRFVSLVDWARDHTVRCINPHEPARRSWDKAVMHLALIDAGLHTPYTIIVKPYQEQPLLPVLDLSPLGEVFTIKPAHGGGGEGVIPEATTLDQVRAARQEMPADKYLLQARIVPAQLGGRRAWFRVIYCLGQVFPCWWDTATHLYTPITPAEESLFGLGPLRRIAAEIARVCELELFSTEIALMPDDQFVVVDYVNDQLDLRVQSKMADGVPDRIVCEIANRLVAHAAHAPCESSISA